MEIRTNRFPDKTNQQPHTQVEEGGRAVRIPEGIRHKYVAVPEDDMQLKVK